MRRLILFVALIALLLPPAWSGLWPGGAQPALAANKMWWASCRTGGGDCLDGIDGATLTAGDGAFVDLDAGSTTPEVYFYRVYASSSSESDPFVITPDTNPGTLRWHLVNIYGSSFKIPKTSGQAGAMGVYEANSTDIDLIGWLGASSIAETWWYQFSGTQPSANQWMIFAAPTGTGGPGSTKTSAQTWMGTGDLISDTAYDATSWDGVTTIAPSKNAVRDKVEAMISDTAYAGSWDGVTTIAPSKNAVYDQMELKAPKADPVFTGSAQIPNGANPTTDAAGEVAVDSSAGAGGGLRIYANASPGAVTIPTYFNSTTTIKDPVATSDFHVFRAPYAITIRQTHCLLTGATNIVGQFDACDGNGANCVAVDSADMTCTTTNSSDTALNGTVAVVAGGYVMWRSTSASGTPTSLIVAFDYTVDQVN